MKVANLVKYLTSIDEDADTVPSQASAGLRSYMGRHWGAVAGGAFAAHFGTA